MVLPNCAIHFCHVSANPAVGRWSASSVALVTSSRHFGSDSIALTQEHTHVTTEAEDHSHIFWGELAPSEHLIQIYEDDDVFLDALEGFVAEGLGVGESVVVIATS